MLAEEGDWRAAKGNYLCPVRALSRRFRGHFVSGLRRRAKAGELERTEPEAVDALLDTLMRTEWVVYAKPCLGHAEQVVAYLARYTHRTALTDRRLVGVEGENVGLRYNDHRDASRAKVLWLEATELIRRFLLHVLPKGLMRIRHYGFLANRCRAERLPRIRAALARDDDTATDTGGLRTHTERSRTERAVAAPDARRCPRCRSGSLRQRALLPSLRFEGG